MYYLVLIQFNLKLSYLVHHNVFFDNSLLLYLTCVEIGVLKFHMYSICSLYRLTSSVPFGNMISVISENQI